MLEFTETEIPEKFPLHCCVWNDNTQKLDELLSSKLYNTELADPHGRTPLLLAVALGFKESVKVLLDHSCDASATDKQGWNVTQEAVGTADPDLISLIVQHREYQRFTQKSGGISEILESLEEADDFYVEMKWEFSSWIPLISRMCPNDSYKIYKSGATVRVDTTLKGFEQMNWQRGNQSFIFKGGTNSSELYEIDHDKKSYWKESVSFRDESMTLESLQPPPSVVSSRLLSQNVTSILDHEHISFTRQKSGILGWGGDKTETVNGYDSKVFTVSGVELVTRTRSEHLSDEDRIKIQEEKKQTQSQLPSFLNVLAQSEHVEAINTEEIIDSSSFNPYELTLEQYFNPILHPGKDVGRLRKMTSRTQKFSATVALSDEFPLSLHEQVLPIIKLMANNSSHFAKLHDFITLQLPAGFPIKIEIPLFHVLNARITFRNINGSEECPSGVVVLTDTDEQKNTASDVASDEDERSSNDSYRDEEDELLQLAIQQSLAESAAGGNDDGVSETSSPQQQQTWMVTGGREEDDLQRAIRESLGENEPPVAHESGGGGVSLSEEEQLRMVMQLSLQEESEAQRLQREEQEELEKVLALSMAEQ